MRKNKNKSKLNLPPSLPSIPLLGSLPFLSLPSQVHKFFSEQVKCYGSVFSFMAGPSYTVVINGHDAIREALVKKAQDFAGRKQLNVDKIVQRTVENAKGIVFRDGELWRQHRTYSMTILKQFGYGHRAVMEERIHGVLGELVEYIKSKNGEAWDPYHMLQISTLKTIARLIFGDNSFTDKETEEFQSFVRISTDICIPIIEVLPLLAYFPPFRGHIEEYRPIGIKYDEYVLSKIVSSQQAADSNNFVKQFIEMTSSTGYDAQELVYILKDLVGAGTETVATSVAWALTILGNRPNIQEKIQKELDAVVPKDRLPSLYDKNNLPYLEATMLEIWRYKTVTPLAIPHHTLCDTSVAGYDVPTDTPVLINLWSAHMDPAVWKDPETFRPERFLDDNMTVINQDLMIIFSMGKRACLGEVLAKQENFLFLAAILHQFNILPPEGESKIIEDEHVTIVVAPAAYKLRLVPRL